MIDPASRALECGVLPPREAPVRLAADRIDPLPRTAVVALGSIVMGDDGAGASALAELEAAFELPDEVDRVDLGTPGPYFAEYVRGYEALIVIDALRTKGAPGEVKRFDEEQLKAVPAGQRLTPHVLDLGEALATLEFEGCKPAKVVAVGVIPDVVRAGTELSPAIRRALPEMAAAVARELAALGFAVRPRDTASARRLWWAKPGEA